MPGDFFKLAGYNGPDTATAQLPSSGSAAFPAGTLANVFARANYFLSLTNPATTAFGSGEQSAGKVTPDPTGLQISGSSSIPALFGAFLRGETISRAFLFTTASGQSGDWLARFWVFGNVKITQLQTYTDSQQGDYPLQFTYAAVLLGHVATPGGAATTSGWNFAASKAWDGIAPL